MAGQQKLIENKWFYFSYILAVHGVLLLGFLTISPVSFSRLFGAQKFYSEAALQYLMAFAALFSAALIIGATFGVHLVTALSTFSRGILTAARLQVLLFGCAALAIIGHLSLFYAGHAIMKSLEGATAAKQEVLLTGTGAPLFLMALTPLFAGLLGYSFFGQTSRRIKFIAAFLGLLVLGCVGIRFLYFERLPLFELGLPVAWFLFRKLKTRTLLIFATAGIFIFVSMFSLAEYFRSWPDYVRSGLYQNTPGDFVEFIFYRLTGYYITPVNHLCMLVRENFGHRTGGYYTFRFMLNTPVIGKTLSNSIPAFHTMIANSDGMWQFLLDPQYGLNPEFNLFGCFGVAFLDWGWGGLLLAAFFGAVGGTLLASARRGLTLGVFGFPIFLIGLAECPRLLYWSHERIFLSIITLLIVSLLLPRVDSDEEAMEQDQT